MTAVATERAAAAHSGSVRQAATLSAALIALGTGLGFVRDLVMAYMFGASDGTDAFLVAWTIPETASPLLIEDAMALLMVPLISHALHHHGGARAIIVRTLPLLICALSAVAALLVLAAPALVGLLAPRIHDPELAVRFLRITSLAVVTFGVAGFMSAALRAHQRFGPPAAIYACYNAGILATIAVAHGSAGVGSAALGVAAGSVLMVAVQAPRFVSCLRVPSSAGASGGSLRSLAAMAAPIVVYTLTRQAQVFVERYYGSGLGEGSISHLNYAQKVAQVPMAVSLMLVTVTFPRLARACAAGDRDQIEFRLRTDLTVAGGLVLAGTAFLCVYAPHVVALLFQHGQFTAADTVATASVIRVYAVGLLGQTLVGALGRVYFAGARPCWHPAAAMAIGLAATVAVAAVATPIAGIAGLGLANATGILVTAGVLLANTPRVVPVQLGLITGVLARLIAAAAVAAIAGCAVERMLAGHVPGSLLLAAGAVTVAAVMCLCAGALGVRRNLRSSPESEPRASIWKDCG